MTWEKPNVISFLLVSLAVYLTLVSSQLAASPVRLTLMDKWSGVFAGEKSSFNVLVASEHGLNGTLRWRLHTQGRTISRQQKLISVMPGGEKQFTVFINPPGVNDGVVFNATLQIEVTEDGVEQPVAQIQQTIRLFNKDPFVQHENALAAIGIALFDPAGKTVAVFESANIPFTRVRGVDSVSGFTGKILIVGEGTQLSHYRGLSTLLLQLADSGVTVLCLAPSSGEFPLNTYLHRKLGKPKTLTLKQQDVIGYLDTRLDYMSWPPDSKVVAASIQLTGDRNGVVGKVETGDTGWPWMEIDFGSGKGKFVFAGFPIIEKWNTGPTPRFLLYTLLNHVRHTDIKKEE